MPDPMDDCWFCNPAVRQGDPPGGWVYQDDWWRVGHGVAGCGPAGTTIVESRRHFLDPSEMNEDEAGTFGPLLSRVVGTVRQTVGADRVYTWATMARHPHLHVWLIPWWQDEPDHGPDYLTRVLENGCAEAEAAGVAERMRALLKRTADSPGTPGASA